LGKNDDNAPLLVERALSSRRRVYAEEVVEGGDKERGAIDARRDVFYADAPATFSPDEIRPPEWTWRHFVRVAYRNIPDSLLFPEDCRIRMKFWTEQEKMQAFFPEWVRVL
jgi:hypothetical protein